MIKNLIPSGGRAGEHCKGVLDERSVHALGCKLGGLLYRRHNSLRDLLKSFLQQAGYCCETEQWEPRWNRPVRGPNGEPIFQRDAAGAIIRDQHGRPVPLLERARLDLRWEAPPEEPRGYGDVVVSLPTASSYEARATATDGATAELHARLKHVRHPAEAVRPGRLYALSVEAYGRWGEEANQLLHHAAARAAARSAGVHRLGGRGSSAVFGRWHAHLSCCLQKANVAALRGACGDARSWSDADAAGATGEAEIGVLTS